MQEEGNFLHESVPYFPYFPRFPQKRAIHTDGVTSSNLVSPTIETKGQDIRPGLFLFYWEDLPRLNGLFDARPPS